MSKPKGRTWVHLYHGDREVECYHWASPPRVGDHVEGHWHEKRVVTQVVWRDGSAHVYTERKRP